MDLINRSRNNKAPWYDTETVYLFTFFIISLSAVTKVFPVHLGSSNAVTL